MATQPGIISQLEAAIEAHGYVVSIEPIAGEEGAFVATLRTAVAEIERTAEHCRQRYGTRGLSKRTLSCLHGLLPNPAWGVEVRS